MSTVRLTKARTFELDPAKKYIIQVKQGAMNREDADTMIKEINRMGIKNVVLVYLPKNQHLKIAEAS